MQLNVHEKLSNEKKKNKNKKQKRKNKNKKQKRKNKKIKPPLYAGLGSKQKNF